MTPQIHIADNNIKNFQIPSFDTGIEILPPPQENFNAQSELSFVSNKLFISFGTMIICAIIIICSLLLLRKRFQSDIKNEEDSVAIHNEIIEKNSGKKHNKKLNTPYTIKECILSFLENTKSD